MATERTLSIIKPSAVAANHIIAAKMLHLTLEQAEKFYGVHREQPFFPELIDFMVSGPILVQVLEGEDAIKVNRDVMGATDPTEAAPGTIRAVYGKNISENAVHGSDAPETAATEIAFFFDQNTIFSR